MICEISPRCGSHTPCKINFAPCTGDYGDVTAIHNANTGTQPERERPQPKDLLQLGAGKQISTYNPSARRSISISLSLSLSVALGPELNFCNARSFIGFLDAPPPQCAELRGGVLLCARLLSDTPESNIWLATLFVSSV